MPHIGFKHSQESKNKMKIARLGIYKGPRHPLWKGGMKITNGYVYMYMPCHPFCKKEGYIKRSRLVIEHFIDRYLTKEEVVHHINEIRNDDRIENLKLFTKREHDSYHMIKRINKHRV